MSAWLTERQAVADAARKVAELGLVSASAGNLSVRLPSDGGRELMAVTASGARCERMRADDVVVTDFDLSDIAGDRAPSSESLLHVGIYRRRADVRAVAHTHSVYSSALAVAGVDLPPVIDELAMYVGGGARVSKYGFPGSELLADNVCDALGDRKAALIANHGAAAVGRTLDEALDTCVLVERACQIYVMARALGGVSPIPDEFVDAAVAIYRMRNSL